jgi:hypothetical protein
MPRLATLIVLALLSTGCATGLGRCHSPQPYYLGAPDPTPAQVQACEERVTAEREADAQKAQDRYECELEAWGAMSGTNQSDRHYGNRVERLVKLCMKARGF